MAIDVAATRAALKTRLETISGLRASSWLTGNINPPVALIGLRPPVEFDQDFDGHAVYRWTITVYVSRADDRAGQDKLDGYLSQSGATSVKAAIEGDNTLGGEVGSVRVTEISQWGDVTVGDVSYLAAEFAAETFA